MAINVKNRHAKGKAGIIAVSVDQVGKKIYLMFLFLEGQEQDFSKCVANNACTQWVRFLVILVYKMHFGSVLMLIFCDKIL